jgi:hypothetical protein
MQRQLIMKAKEIGDLEMDKRGRERQLKNTTASLSTSEQEADKIERNLNSDLRDKEEELERLKLMIKDKRIEIDAKGPQHSHMGSP